jgi:LytTr DNA-binding domain
MRGRVVWHPRPWTLQFHMDKSFDSQALLARYQPWRRMVEIGFWVALYCSAATINTVLVIMAFGRNNTNFASWQPAVWEWSSSLVLLALVPAVIAFDKRYPLILGQLKQNFPKHLVASVIYSLFHVLAMVAIRKMVYATQGETYDFGAWPREFFYEYLKDFRSYFGAIFIIAFYQLLLLRLQGEASLLAAPDAGEPVESVEKPTRFLVKKLGKEFLLPANEVEWLQAWGNYVNLRVRGRDYPLRTTMNEIETRLDATTFIRVHRSYIVNLDFVETIEPLDSGDARANMRDGEKVAVSRRYRDKLRQLAR